MTATAQPNATVDLDPDLQEALRLGPFHRALKAAIATSGLTLERLEVRLAERSIPVGRSTLSYWQQGTRRPERPRSLAALAALEELLGLPPTALSSLLGPRKPRGRWTGYRGQGLEWSEMWGPGEDIRRLISIDSRRNNDKLLTVSLTETFAIGADRRMQWLEINNVTRARENGADRLMIVLRTEEDHDSRRVGLIETTNCRLGRQRALNTAKFAAFELLFDRALPLDATHMFSYRVDFASGFLTPDEMADRGVGIVASTDGRRGFRRPVHSYVLAAQFDPTQLPVRCYHVRSNRVGTAEQVVGELTINAFGSTHVALQDVQPGVHGLRWEWD
ncbi:MAG: hypothetical protein ABJA87_14025 [bacterium]